MAVARPRRQARSQLRRRQILAAALACFTEAGGEQATVPEIGRRAGASIGSIYHQFGSKDGVAAALYLEGLAGYQRGLIHALLRATRAREGIVAAVRYHLRWAERHWAWARFLLEARRARFMVGQEDALRALNREFGRALGAWFRPHVEAGRLRPLPVDLYAAILLAPAQEWVRGRLGGRAVCSCRQAEDELGAATWRALAVHPGPVSRSERSV